MKKKLILSVIIAIPVLICFVIIFLFSSQDNVKTNDLSRSFTKKIAEIVFSNFSAMKDDIKNNIILEMNLFIRKAAHFSIYLIMSVFIYAEAVLWLKKYFLGGIVSVGICSFYAVIDEFHQSLVPGRTPLVKDVIIDSCGAIFGTLVCFFIISAIFFIRSHRKK